MDDAPPNDYYDVHDRCIIAHAVFAGIVVFGFLPAALIAARYRRNDDPKMRSIHVNCNTAVLALVTIIFFLGLGGVLWEGQGNQFTPSMIDTHHAVGLGTFLFVWMQYLGGLAFKRWGGKLPSRATHIAVGLLTTGLLYTAYFSGLDEWGTMSDVQTQTPVAVYIVSWVLFFLLAATWVFGLSWRHPQYVEWQEAEMVQPLLEKGSTTVAEPPVRVVVLVR